MTHTMPNGYTIEIHQVDTGTQFTTINPAGEVVSTSRLSFPLDSCMIAAIERSAL